MATLRERLRARREAERRGLRSFTIGVSEDDLRVIAEHNCQGRQSTRAVDCQSKRMQLTVRLVANEVRT